MVHRLYQKKFARQMLISLYGINICTANKIMGLLGLHPLARGYKLISRKNAAALQGIIDSLRIEFRLRLIVLSRICLQLCLGTYRGIRRLQGLPCRGQRTHANGKTSRRLKASGNNFPFNFKRAHAKAQAHKKVINNLKKNRNKGSAKNIKPKYKKLPKKNSKN